MGEKIKDLHTITIGSSDLMIELNEGYTKNEGRLIHIQNKHFRYLLKEKNFIKLAATVLRAKSEMDYIKTDMASKTRTEVIEDTEKFSGSDKSVAVAKDVLLELGKKGVRYRLLDSGNAYITVVIEKQDYKKYRSCFEHIGGLKEIPHPYGEKVGFVFLYQMTPFELFMYKGICIEIYFQLPCMSLTPNTWIPLDREIQKWFWNNADEKDGIYHSDQLSLCLYLICWAIFKRGYFSSSDVSVIEKNSEIINSEIMHCLMEKVFFQFTDSLLEMINHEDYSSIIVKYYEFKDY